MKLETKKFLILHIWIALVGPCIFFGLAEISYFRFTPVATFCIVVWVIATLLYIFFYRILIRKSFESSNSRQISLKQILLISFIGAFILAIYRRGDEEFFNVNALTVSLTVMATLVSGILQTGNWKSNENKLRWMFSAGFTFQILGLIGAWTLLVIIFYSNFPIYTQQYLYNVGPHFTTVNFWLPFGHVIGYFPVFLFMGLLIKKIALKKHFQKGALVWEIIFWGSLFTLLGFAFDIRSQIWTARGHSGYSDKRFPLEPFNRYNKYSNVSPDGMRKIIINSYEGKIKLSPNNPLLQNPKWNPNRTFFDSFLIRDIKTGKILYTRNSKNCNLAPRFVTNDQIVFGAEKDNFPLMFGAKSPLQIYRVRLYRRYPEYWWGHFYRVEVWVLLVATALLAFRAFGCWRRMH